MQETILVTGASGFIGRYLIEKLKRIGYTTKNFSIEQGDIRRKEDCEKAVRGVSRIIHLAAELNEKSNTLFETNVNGTENLLEAAERQRIKQFIFVSSAGIYGDVKGIATEETKPEPLTNYEKSKLMAEQKVLEFQESLAVTIVRPALALGPNSYWREIIKLIKKCFPIIGSGNNFFQIIYAEDFADALAFLIDREEAIGEIFNIAADDAKTLNEFYEICLEKLGIKNCKPKHIPIFAARLLALFSKSRIITQEHITRLVKNRRYSIEKIKAIGWQPKYTTERAIEGTIKELKLQGGI
ncbi:MAG: NAD(P)-dependent oxidoreductase [Candidatus Diapherotrites archaeon]|nr:NAD(P)-dependent oxidoreductase [Candidatus Diapherotrites archaeon]